MEELLSGLIGQLPSLLIGAIVTLLGALAHHRHKINKERRAVAREKLEAAIAAAERVLLRLKWIQRVEFTLKQISGNDTPKYPETEKDLSLMEAECRKEMEEALLQLTTFCNAHFHGDEVSLRLNEFDQTAREAYATAARQVPLEKVKQRKEVLIAALRVKAKEYKG